MIWLPVRPLDNPIAIEKNSLIRVRNTEQRHILNIYFIECSGWVFMGLCVIPFGITASNDLRQFLDSNGVTQRPWGVISFRF